MPASAWQVRWRPVPRSSHPAGASRFESAMSLTSSAATSSARACAGNPSRGWKVEGTSTAPPRIALAHVMDLLDSDISPLPSRLLRRLPRNVWVVSATSLLTDASTETLTGLLPFYLTLALGAPPAAVGLIEGVGEATASLVKLASGWASDRWRRRKPLAVFGYGLSTVAKATLLAATTWPLVLMARLLERAGKGIRTAPRDALLADSVPAGSRGLSFGLHRAADTAGAVLGTTIALLLVVAGGGTTVSVETLRLAVLISLVPAAAGVILLAWKAREIRPAAALP